jgi:hypothetical protein
MNTEIKVGKHRVVLEKEDLVGMYLAASPTLEEMLGIIEAQVELVSGRPYFLLIDMTLVETLSAPVRRAVGEASNRVTFKGIGVVGATFHIKVVTRLINSALALFRRTPLPQAFFDKREEAHAWFDELRTHSPGGAA